MKRILYPGILFVFLTFIVTIPVIAQPTDYGPEPADSLSLTGKVDSSANEHFSGLDRTQNLSFSKQFKAALSGGTPTLIYRPRAEFAAQFPLRNSEAITHRLQAGYTTGEIYNFSGHIDFIHSFAYTPKRFNPASLTKRTDRVVVADPKLTVLNQVYAQYNLEKAGTIVRAGRQRIILDDARFIGNVGWRQNEQTFDAATFESAVMDSNLTVHYSYLWQINRVLGPQHPAGIYDSDSHLMQLSFSGFPYTKVTGFTYLLSFPGLGEIVSSDTFGGRLESSIPFQNNRYFVDFHISYAFQESTSKNLTIRDASADYYKLRLSLAHNEVATIGGAFEVLGGDNLFAFRTPLATLHAHQGWADRFLSTPSGGLEDFHLFASVELPSDISLFGRYHWFNNHTLSRKMGEELNISASKSITDFWSILIKHAEFMGDDILVSSRKFWVQMLFQF